MVAGGLSSSTTPHEQFGEKFSTEAAAKAFADLTQGKKFGSRDHLLFCFLVFCVVAGMAILVFICWIWAVLITGLNVYGYLTM